MDAYEHAEQMHRLARIAERWPRLFRNRIRRRATAAREDPELAEDLRLEGNLVHSAAGNMLHGLAASDRADARLNFATARRQLEEALERQPCR